MPTPTIPTTCTELRNFANQSMAETVEKHSRFPKQVTELAKLFEGPQDAFVNNLLRAGEQVESARPPKEELIPFFIRKGQEIVAKLKEFGSPRNTVVQEQPPELASRGIKPDESLAGTVYLTVLALMHRMKKPLPDKK